MKTNKTKVNFRMLGIIFCLLNGLKGHAKTLHQIAAKDTIIFIFNDSLGKASIEKVVVGIKENKVFKNKGRIIERKEMLFTYKCSNAFFWSKNHKKSIQFPNSSTTFKSVCSKESPQLLLHIWSQSIKCRLFIFNESSNKMYEVDMSMIL